MLSPKTPASALIDRIQERTDDGVREAIHTVEALGGKAAVDDFLQHHVSYVAGLVIATYGQARACRMMAGGLFAAEHYSSEGLEC